MINMEIQAFGKSEAEAQEDCQNDLPGDKRISELWNCLNTLSNKLDAIWISCS